MKISNRLLSLLVLVVAFAATQAQTGRRELQKTTKTNSKTTSGGVVTAPGAGGPAGVGVAAPSPVDVSGGAGAGVSGVVTTKGKGSSKGFFNGGVVGGIGGNGKGNKGKGSKGKGGKGKGGKGKGNKAKKAKKAKAKKAKKAKAKKAKKAKAKKSKNAKAKTPTPPGVITPTPPGVTSPPPVAPPVPGVVEPPTPPCTCAVSAVYNANATISLNFDYCNPAIEAQPFDWIGIYKCDARTITATQEWWAGILNNTGYIGLPNVAMDYYGFVEGQVYVIDQQILWTYTCGVGGADAGTGCQTDPTTQWPTSGSILIDPATLPDWQTWGNGMDFDGLQSGQCYKAILNRELKNAISPPPLPTICPGQPWETALTFTVP